MKNARPKKMETSAVQTPAIFPQQDELFEPQTLRHFAGTINPRHLRVIAAMVSKDGIFREELDRIAGCSNGPELMAELRRRGLSWDCRRIDSLDRDGRACKPGWYYLTSTGRRQIIEWQASKKAA